MTQNKAGLANINIKIKDWDTFQSYKDRKPLWIRLHKALLDNFDYHMMSDKARAILPMLWLLASEDSNPRSGIIRYGYDRIAFRLRQKEADIEKVCKEIESYGFITINKGEYNSVTGSLQNGNTAVTTETETETDKEKRESKHACGEFKNVLLTKSEFDNLVQKFSREQVKTAIQVLDDYINSKGAKYRSHYTVLLRESSWVWERVKEINGTSDKPKPKDPSKEFERVLNEILLGYEKATDPDGYLATIWDKYKDIPKVNGVHVVSYAKKKIKEANQ